MEETPEFHYLVRGIVIAEGRVLVVRQRGADNTFLPGGHIESGERAEAALTREIEEELGRRPTIKRFLGAAEHVWPADTRANHEVNLLFEMEIRGLSPDRPPVSLEPHLEFLWVELRQVAKVNLQPFVLWDFFRTEIGRYAGYWDSTIGES